MHIVRGRCQTRRYHVISVLIEGALVETEMEILVLIDIHSFFVHIASYLAQRERRLRALLTHDLKKETNNNRPSDIKKKTRIIETRGKGVSYERTSSTILEANKEKKQSLKVELKNVKATTFDHQRSDN